MRQRTYHLYREQCLPRGLSEVFDFFARAGNLERITPPWLGFALLTPEPVAIGAGTLIEYRLHLHRIPLRWLSRIDVWEPRREFVDVQVEGPYRLWHHRHEFHAVPGGTRVCDHVSYALPLGPIGALAHTALVKRDLARIFDFRQAAVARLLG